MEGLDNARQMVYNVTKMCFNRIKHILIKIILGWMYMRLKIIGKALLLLFAIICAIVSLVNIVLTVLLINVYFDIFETDAIFYHLYTGGVFRDLFFEATLLLFSTLYSFITIKNGFLTSFQSVVKITVEDIRAYEERKKEEAEGKKKQRLQAQIEALQEQLNNEETE